MRRSNINLGPQYKSSLAQFVKAHEAHSASELKNLPNGHTWGMLSSYGIKVRLGD